MGYYLLLTEVARQIHTKLGKLMERKTEGLRMKLLFEKKKFKSPSKWEDGKVFHYIKG